MDDELRYLTSLLTQQLRGAYLITAPNDDPYSIPAPNLYVIWSCASTRVPFIELTRTPYLSELDFGWLRIHIKIDWRPKDWNEAEWQARLARWWG